jgi:DNA-binding response OmpR family regulator
MWAYTQAIVLVLVNTYDIPPMNTLDQKKILVIEDEDFLMRACKLKFEREGYLFLSARNGVEGLDVARTEKPDVILMDVMMPEMNGFDLLRVLKSESALKDIPVIILSNLGQDSDRVLAERLGATEYLVKAHVPLVKVVERVEHALSRVPSTQSPEEQQVE